MPGYPSRDLRHCSKRDTNCLLHGNFLMNRFYKALLILALIVGGRAAADQIYPPPPPGGLFTVTGALKGNGAGVVSQAACADLSNATTYCSATQGQLPGIASNTAAAAGNIGEYITSSVASPGGAISNNVAANITSVSITAGDWDC